MKKKILSILLVAFMAVLFRPMTVFADTQPPAYADSGSGTKADPYIIMTLDQLKALADTVNGANGMTANNMYDKYFKLGADIGTFTDVIAKDNEHRFRGNFDGAGYTITLNIETDSQYAGLFGATSNSGGGSISNLTVDGSVTSTCMQTNASACGICGNANIPISNCRNKATIKGVKDVAGITGSLGSSFGKLINCCNEGQITQTDSLTFGRVAGIAANSDGKIYNCFNSGDLTLSYNSGGQIGGIVAFPSGSTDALVANCYNSGNFTVASATEKQGAICAYPYNTITIKNCYFDKNVNEGLDICGKADSDKSTKVNCSGLSTEQMKAAPGEVLSTGVADNKPLVDLLNGYQESGSYPTDKCMWKISENSYPVLKLGKTPVTISGVSMNSSYTYDGNPVAPTGTPSAVERGTSTSVTILEYTYTYYQNTGTTETPSWNSLGATAPTNIGSYKLVVSVPESNVDYAGSSADILFAITKVDVSAPSLGDAVTIDYVNEKIKPKTNYEISTTSGSGFGTDEISIAFGTTYYIRKMEDDTHNASAETPYKPERPSVSGVSAHQETYVKKDDAYLDGVSSAMEYCISTDNGSTYGTWTAGTDTKIDFTFKGNPPVVRYDVKVRVKGTESSFIGSDATYTFVPGEKMYIVKLGENEQQVAYGDKLTKPEDPTKEGYSFDGWYSDEGCTKKWNFETDVVTESMELYPKWIKNSPDTPDNLPFVDVKTKDWSYDDIFFVWKNGLMKGTSDTTFAPKVDTSRAMIVTMLWRIEGEPIVNSEMSFADVKADQWYTEAIRWAQHTGVVNGYSAEKFGPNDIISREQVAVILYRYAEYKGYDVTARAELSKFDDASQISGWATESASWANALNFVRGVDDTTIKPQGSATREQVAAIIHRFSDEYRKDS